MSNKLRKLDKLANDAAYLWTADYQDVAPSDRISRRAIALRKILEDSEGWVSGKAIASTLECSPQLVKVMIARLKEGGWPIETKRFAGYRVTNPTLPRLKHVGVAQDLSRQR